MNLFRQVILLTLTLLVLVSSTGFAVGKHVCAGELRSVAVFGLAKACPMEQPKKQLPPCHQSEEDSTDKQKDNSCCQDKTVVIDGLDHQTDAKVAANNFAPNLKFVAVFSLTLAHILSGQATPSISYTPYTSPPLARDIPVLVQSFLL